MLAVVRHPLQKVGLLNQNAPPNKEQIKQQMGPGDRFFIGLQNTNSRTIVVMLCVLVMGVYVPKIDPENLFTLIKWPPLCVSLKTEGSRTSQAAPVLLLGDRPAPEPATSI